MANTIDTVCGIYETQYRLINHRDGSLSVIVPFIKWTNNNGCLSFKKISIERFADDVQACFDDYHNFPRPLSYDLDDCSTSIGELIYCQPQYFFMKKSKL